MNTNRHRLTTRSAVLNLARWNHIAPTVSSRAVSVRVAGATYFWCAA